MISGASATGLMAQQSMTDMGPLAVVTGACFGAVVGSRLPSLGTSLWGLGFGLLAWIV
ncbi:MAG: hypothetical protein ACRDPW_09315 [Mycobacteriales bacterium]